MEKLIRYDMSKFQTQESLGLLLGSRPGEKEFLGAAYERTKTGTLLFDEVEKAHPRIMDVFLQMLDAARVTIATCETLDLSGFYIVMTSNIGSAELMTLQHSAESTLERHVPRPTIIAPGKESGIAAAPSPLKKLLASLLVLAPSQIPSSLPLFLIRAFFVLEIFSHNPPSLGAHNFLHA
jgi:hypothetical protein